MLPLVKKVMTTILMVVPWVTNLRSDKFAALFAADFKDGSQPWIITIPSEAEVSAVLKIQNLFPFRC